ncbi:hypothetical protein K445DRAFT_314703 [Daldinia sp. EC12]|nr:hypothetical protein K445DRAFT_314703 [Daldinia sp. EC12]
MCVSFSVFANTTSLISNCNFHTLLSTNASGHRSPKYVYLFAIWHIANTTCVSTRVFYCIIPVYKY